jgi:large subunit ribosomal protein L2
MGLRALSPTTPGNRNAVVITYHEITCTNPEKKIIRSNVNICGKSMGFVCRGRGGGHSRMYRKIDFKRKNVYAIGNVRSIQYDPNRTAHIALINYARGEKKYILAPKGIKRGIQVVSGFRVPLKIGNSIPLWNIPIGIQIHNVELRPGGARCFSRSAGTWIRMISRINGVVNLCLPSGKIRTISQLCWARLGQVSAIETRNKKSGKAGRMRWIGKRPKVRGRAKNPVDHQHGGGEGRRPVGHIHPFTPWGKPRLGMKTRSRRKYSNSLLR